MVMTKDPETVRNEVACFFREAKLPEILEWAADLSPLSLRLFAVELADALKEAVITGKNDQLIILLGDWQATAELESAPEVWEEIRKPKVWRPLSDFVTV